MRDRIEQEQLMNEVMALRARVAELERQASARSRSGRRLTKHLFMPRR
ncbi:MAG: hypothetical protein A4E57_04327 [Syntrophorhabdaceae bacterium PtaU1.Bin034]|nr:MAG: hypothetical protein A4E57_04327 [Syntrophorhabdaceae bacterium PtaU1.Bin034]